MQSNAVTGTMYITVDLPWQRVLMCVLGHDNFDNDVMVVLICIFVNNVSSCLHMIISIALLMFWCRQDRQLNSNTDATHLNVCMTISLHCV